MKFKNEIARIYDSSPENEWERLDRHRTEFEVTLQAMDAYLPPPAAKILDCGGGPGRYTLELAQHGHNVTLFDLSAGNLALARQKSAEAGVAPEDFIQGNATDLSRFGENSFDAVLLMGPLYHLLEETDRRKALAECYRVLKPGGCLMAAFITRYAPIKYCIPNELTWPIENPELFNSIYERGIFPPRGERDGEFVAYFAQPTEVSPLVASKGFEVQAVLGVEGLVSQLEDEINELTGKAWKFWVDFNYQIAPDPSIHGAVEHLLVVATKPIWRGVLKEVATLLNEAGIPYKIVGGTVAGLYGIPIKVNDIDIEFGAEDVYRAEEILAEFMTDRVAFKESEVYRSHIGHLEVDGHLVEIFGGLERRQGGGWVPSMAVTESTLELDGIPVSVPWLEEEVLAYLRRGKLQRAGFCLPYCDSQRLQYLLEIKK